MEYAAGTRPGEWWILGGDSTVWDAIAYHAEADVQTIPGDDWDDLGTWKGWWGTPAEASPVQATHALLHLPLLHMHPHRLRPTPSGCLWGPGLGRIGSGSDQHHRRRQSAGSRHPSGFLRGISNT